MGLGPLPFEEKLWFLGLFSWEEGQLNSGTWWQLWHWWKGDERRCSQALHRSSWQKELKTSDGEKAFVDQESSVKWCLPWSWKIFKALGNLVWLHVWTSFEWEVEQKAYLGLCQPWLSVYPVNFMGILYAYAVALAKGQCWRLRNCLGRI